MSKRPPGDIYPGKRLPTNPYPPQPPPLEPSLTPDPSYEAEEYSPTPGPSDKDPPNEAEEDSPTTFTFQTDTGEEFPFTLDDDFFSLPLLPPTTLDLLVELEFALDARPQPQHSPYRWYAMYNLYWELYQLRFIPRGFFDRGVTVTYPLINTPELLDLHARINFGGGGGGEVTGIDGPVEPWSMADYWRLIGAVQMVFKGAGDGDVNTCLHVTAHVVARMERERRRRRGV